MRPPKNRFATPEQRVHQFWALFDAKDYQALLAIMTDDAMETDDFAKVWLRGRAAIRENFARIGKRFDESHTRVRDVQVTETPEIAVATCVVNYQLLWDGSPFTADAPTTMIFVREPGTWRLRLLHTR